MLERERVGALVGVIFPNQQGFPLDIFPMKPGTQLIEAALVMH